MAAPDGWNSLEWLRCAAVMARSAEKCAVPDKTAAHCSIERKKTLQYHGAENEQKVSHSITARFALHCVPFGWLSGAGVYIKINAKELI